MLFRSAAAVVAVIAGGIGKEPVGGHVVVLVHQVHTDAFHLGPEVVELVTIGVGAGGANNLDVGIVGADGFGKDFQTLGIDLIPLFVTDANHFEVERLRMSHLGTQLSPGGSSGAIGEFDKVEGILHVEVELVEGHHFVALVLAGEAATENGKRFGSEILTQQEVFVVAQTQTLEIVGESLVLEGVVPAVLIQRTVLHRAHGVLPLVAGGKGVALDDAAAGEAEDAGVEVIERLGEVGTQTVLSVLPGLDGEERDVVHVHRTLRQQHHAQTRVGIGEGGAEEDGLLLPAVAADFDFLGQQILAAGVQQLNGELHGASIGSAGIGSETVFLALLEADATETFVVEPGTQPTAVVDDAHVVGIAVEAGLGVLHRDVAKGYPANEGLRELEGAVLHQFSVESAVGTEVDVFEEDAVHRGLYLGCRPGYVNGHYMLCLRTQGARQ